MIIDQFTKWLEIVPIPNQNSITIAKAMVDNFISKYGCPSELHSDQGKNVDGVLVRKLCDLLQIAKTRTTAYHPQSNGQVERYNRLVLQAIRCYINNKQSEWNLHLQQIAGAIRSTENRQTKFTPFFCFLEGKQLNL
jgi:transposase InsO family protein